MSQQPTTFTSGRRLARNAVWNFVGLAVPMLVAVVAIPALIDTFGKERFGLLALIWSGIGYFSLFDMGLGRALTKLIAERLGGQRKDHGSLIWTALFLIVSLGAVGGVLVAWGAELLVSRVLEVDSSLHEDAISAFRILAVGLPFVIASSALIGILEAHQRFFIITIVRVPMGIMMFAAPLATALISPSLTLATAGLLLVRMVALFAYFAASAAVSPELKHPQWLRLAYVPPLFRFGGWLTVTNVVGPMMVYFDRFVIGAMATMTSVTYYVTPYEVLHRLMVLPQSVANVLFPVMTMAVKSNNKDLERLYAAGAKALFYLMMPLMSGLFLLAPDAIDFWLGGDFRKFSTPVVHWLTLGYLINSCAFMPLTVLQSAGRPDLVAKAHLFELVPYIVTLWLFTREFGIAGTAAAWFLRAFADTIILNWLAYRVLPELSRWVKRTLLLTVSLPLVFLTLLYVTVLWQKAAIVFAMAAVSALLLRSTLRLAGQAANIESKAR